ncbi:helix-turn-helix domain-containing protein [Aliikangiella maris]|uniref:Helix-turn-helix transcriptional regulator n=2 Tax=Aliikangiella maris TaxID=3162458 RepID=A0ABV3MVD8_9GAMM
MALIQKLVNHMTPQDKDYYQALGQRIAQYRKAQNLTQVQLAEFLGISQQTMAHYEGGHLRIAVSMLLPLAKKLMVSIDELIGEQSAVKKKRGPTSKLEQQIAQIQQLPRTKQRFVTEMLDTVLQQQSG